MISPLFPSKGRIELGSFELMGVVVTFPCNRSRMATRNELKSMFVEIFLRITHKNKNWCEKWPFFGLLLIGVGLYQ